jgi:hypothetical protein
VAELSLTTSVEWPSQANSAIWLTHISLNVEFVMVALCAVSLIMRDLLTDLGHFSGMPARPVDQNYEHSHQNLS